MVFLGQESIRDVILFPQLKPSNMAEDNKCPICNCYVSLVAPYQGGSSKLSCNKCGSFEIGTIAVHEVSCWTAQQRINLSGWIRENQNFKILSSNLKQLAELKGLTVG